MNRFRATVLVIGFASAVQLVLAEDASGKIGFKFGGDFLARYEFKDNWPDKGKATAGSAYDEHFRLRSRVWGEMSAGDDFTTYIRLGNEFRKYRNAANNDKQQFPDELYLDNFYVNWKQESVGVKLGRQDIKKGAGRIIADGTPGDGARTAHFDAAVVTFNFFEKSTIDFIGTWNHYRDDLTIGHTVGGVYDMTYIKSGDPYSKMDEYGLMAYSEIRENKDFPLDVYWIWKAEEAFYSKEDLYPGRDFSTVGVYLTPKLTDWLSPEVEMAYQFGCIDSGEGMKSRDISAGMVYAGLAGSAKSTVWSPSLKMGLLYLSGDEDSYFKTKNGSTDSNWNPVFNRTTWFSQIGSGMYDQYRWSNLVYPNVELGVKPAKGHSITLETGPMYAAEKDNSATDDYKGYLVAAKYGFPLPTVAGMKLAGQVTGEVFDFGDYYVTTEDRATWLRLEVSAKF